VRILEFIYGGRIQPGELLCFILPRSVDIPKVRFTQCSGTESVFNVKFKFNSFNFNFKFKFNFSLSLTFNFQVKT